MREQFENIWPLDQLSAWQVLVAVCPRCAHRERLGLAEVRALHPEIDFVHEIEPWLACRRCGNRSGNRIAMQREVRNY
jgi:hypothetical protein